MPTKPTGRPRGRPPGAKNIPKIEDFVAETLANPVPVPKRKNRKPRGSSVGMTPEQRSEYFRQLGAKRSKAAGGIGKGVPQTLTYAQHEALVAEQVPIIDRIIKKMAATGELPDDPDVVEAFKKTMVLLRTQSDAKTILASARLILDFKKAKPTAKVEHTIKTAEDYLDEIVEDEA